MNRLLFALFGVLMLASQTGVFAESCFNRLDVRHGLDNNYVSSLSRDRNGLVWIVTPEGVSSWDGYAVISYPVPEEVFPSLLCSDALGRQWALPRAVSIGWMCATVWTITMYPL